MRNNCTKIVLFILLPVILISCNVVKHVPDDKHLLEKNTIVVNDKTDNSLELQSYLQQKPNQRILGIPFSLHIYNLGNIDTLSVQWPDNKPEFKDWFSKKFSKKQLEALRRTSKGFNKWILKSGNAPVISDPKKIKRSATALEDYFFNNGFWDASASFKELKKENKKTSIEYSVITGKPYFLDSVSAKIESPTLDSIYQLHKEKSLVKQGQQYNNENFEKEADRLTSLFRNSGIYSFSRNNIGFDVDEKDTTSNNNYKQNVVLRIRDRQIQKGDSIVTEPFKIQKIKKVNVYTDFSFNTKDQQQKDSATYNKINFYSIDKLEYNPKYLANSIIIQPDSIYKDSERDLTRKYLRDLQNFRPSVDIKYQENDDKTLTANIFLTPLKKYSLSWDTEFTTSNIKPFGVLGKLSFLNRNVFKGAEIFELSFQGSFLNTSIGADGNNQSFFNALEIGSSASLKIPRILFPFNTSKIIPKRMIPKTNISLSLGFRENIGLDRQNITGGIDYTWQSSKTTSHKLELLNVQYINNRNENNYFNVYRSEFNKLTSISDDDPPNNELNTIPVPQDRRSEFYEIIDNKEVLIPQKYIRFVLDSVELASTRSLEYAFINNVEEQRKILVEDVLVPVISYGITYNNRENFRDNSFSTFTGRLISSGSITTAFVNKTNEDGRKVLFGLPVAQYIKTELEYKKYWAFNENSTLVFRNFIGAAVPFGNSDVIPFSRSYRAGGSNDIRAWRTFDLGPGSELSTLEFNVSNFKLTSNLEYRFKLINSLNAALFIDAGNIWDISNSPVSSSEAKFSGFNSIKDIAVGSGFGARYDFSFLIFRFDIGFKTYEPYLPDTNKWFKNYNFSGAIYNIGINYPF